MSTVIAIAAAVVCAVAVVVILGSFWAAIGNPENWKAGAPDVRKVARRDVFLSRDDIIEIAKFGWAMAGSSGNAPDTMAAQRYPGWSTLGAFDALHRERVISMSPDDVVECAGVWLRPSGSVILVPVGIDQGEVLGRVLQEVEEGGRASRVYLSRQDVYDLAHHNFYIPINRGYHHRHVERRYPGWSWEELHGALRRSGHLQRCDQREVSARHLPEGSIGVLISRAGEVVLDDGSLVHPAREHSWERQDGWRLSEHCAFRRHVTWSPVIIHAPHTSLHVPTSVRTELLLDDEGLYSELAAMTDFGVAEVLDRLSSEKRPEIVVATMSRLVFDPERFPVGDEMEAVGMGFVYTRRADGTPLRSELVPERLEWYRSQHRAYTESLERVVDGTLERFGAAMIIDLHSYPKEPLGYEDSTRHRPQVCVGTDAFHTPDWLQALAVEVFGGSLEVVVDTPFSGAYVPGRFYKSDQRVASVMLEVRRDVLAERAEEFATMLSTFCDRASTRQREMRP
jgi:N-formylglutamate deformylase